MTSTDPKMTRMQLIAMVYMLVRVVSSGCQPCVSPIGRRASSSLSTPMSRPASSVDWTILIVAVIGAVIGIYGLATGSITI